MQQAGLDGGVWLGDGFSDVPQSTPTGFGLDSDPRVALCSGSRQVGGHGYLSVPVH